MTPVRALVAFALGAVLFGWHAGTGLAQPAEDAIKTVEAEGVATIAGGDVARARDEALVDAYRRALEAAEVHVQSLTHVRNFQVLMDGVTASGTGYLRALTVLRERTEGGLYRVRVRAVVAPGDIAGDRQGLAVFIGMMDNPTVVVAVSGPDQYARLAETALAGQFAAAGFHVVRQTDLGPETSTRLAAGEDRRFMLLTSVRTMSDILILGTLDAESLGQIQLGTETLESAEAILRVRVVLGATGQTLSAGLPQARGLHITAGGALRAASQNVGERAGAGLIWEVAREYSPLTSASRSIQVIVLARDYGRFTRLVARMREIRGVGGRAYLRAYDGGVGVVDVQSNFPLRILLPRLEALGLHVVAAQANRVVMDSRQ